MKINQEFLDQLANTSLGVSDIWHHYAQSDTYEHQQVYDYVNRVVAEIGYPKSCDERIQFYHNCLTKWQKLSDYRGVHPGERILKHWYVRFILELT